MELLEPVPKTSSSQLPSRSADLASKNPQPAVGACLLFAESCYEFAGVLRSTFGIAMTVLACAGCPARTTLGVAPVVVVIDVSATSLGPAERATIVWSSSTDGAYTVTVEGRPSRPRVIARGVAAAGADAELILAGETLFEGDNTVRILVIRPNGLRGVAELSLRRSRDGVAPAGLSYMTNPVEYRVGLPIAPNTPTVTGGSADVFTIEQSLPAGLTLDPATGTISGTPLAVLVAKDYLVTATNAAGHASAVLRIGVIANACDVNVAVPVWKTTVFGEHDTAMRTITFTHACDSVVCSILDGGTRAPLSCAGSATFSRADYDSDRTVELRFTKAGGDDIVYTFRPAQVAPGLRFTVCDQIVSGDETMWQFMNRLLVTPPSEPPADVRPADSAPQAAGRTVCLGPNVTVLDSGQAGPAVSNVIAISGAQLTIVGVQDAPAVFHNRMTLGSSGAALDDIGIFSFSYGARATTLASLRLVTDGDTAVALNLYDSAGDHLFTNLDVQMAGAGPTAISLANSSLGPTRVARSVLRAKVTLSPYVGNVARNELIVEDSEIRGLDFAVLHTGANPLRIRRSAITALNTASPQTLIALVRGQTTIENSSIVSGGRRSIGMDASFASGGWPAVVRDANSAALTLDHTTIVQSGVGRSALSVTTENPANPAPNPTHALTILGTTVTSQGEGLLVDVTAGGPSTVSVDGSTFRGNGATAAIRLAHGQTTLDNNNGANGFCAVAPPSASFSTVDGLVSVDESNASRSGTFVDAAQLTTLAGGVVSNVCSP